jgi:hypothetical protein
MFIPISVNKYNTITSLITSLDKIIGSTFGHFRFRHLFVCFQTSVYTLGEFHKNRNNSTVFEKLSVSIVDLTVSNICFTGSASRRQ